MIVSEALTRIGVTVDNLNAREQRTGLPSLQDADVSWPALGRELQARLGLVALQTLRDGRPQMRSLDALGAWVVVCQMALAAAEELDVTTGEGLAA